MSKNSFIKHSIRLVNADRYTTYIPDLTSSQGTLKNSLKDRSSDKNLHWQSHRHAHQESMQSNRFNRFSSCSSFFWRELPSPAVFLSPSASLYCVHSKLANLCTIPRPAPSRFRYRGGMSGPPATTVLYPRRARPTVHAESKWTQIAGPLPPLREYKPCSKQSVSTQLFSWEFVPTHRTT